MVQDDCTCNKVVSVCNAAQQGKGHTFSFDFLIHLALTFKKVRHTFLLFTTLFKHNTQKSILDDERKQLEKSTIVAVHDTRTHSSETYAPALFL